MSNHGTLKFTQPRMNYVLVETWVDFKLSSPTIFQKYFKKTHLPPPSPSDIGTNHQDFLVGTQMSNRDKADNIGRISKSSIAPIDMEEVSTTGPMVILR